MVRNRTINAIAARIASFICAFVVLIPYPAAAEKFQLRCEGRSGGKAYIRKEIIIDTQANKFTYTRDRVVNLTTGKKNNFETGKWRKLVGISPSRYTLEEATVNFGGGLIFANRSYIDRYEGKFISESKQKGEHVFRPFMKIDCFQIDMPRTKF